ncbi:MAG: asparagine synthase (glutamine-hydrolyzing) [Candidatus Omnitrophica bacterium]|nr:asparagine synthase (glutamine-hydrolyzing) [Candidatus Omnitrophota bacterium]
MCGICGILSYKDSYSVTEDTIGKMCLEMQHRGPDGQGIYLSQKQPQVGLGHRRLSIIDLSEAGRQPMSNETGSLWIVFNGEIYNFQELTVELKGKGHRFISHTDTEAVLHAYEEYGSECLKHLRGMFAFAVWDLSQKKMILARDRIGKKPLYYHYKNGIFCFASEFSAILQSGLIEKEINSEAVDFYLTFGYIPAPMTIYRDVFKLMPGSFLTLSDQKIELRRYWSLDYSKKIKISESDAKNEVLSRCREAVKLRLRSDVPLGAFLSGGIDSSAVVALMSESMGSRVKTFSIGFEESGYNELFFARKVAEKYNTEHHEFIVKPDALKILPVLVQRFGEPFADSSAIPTYYVAEQTRKSVTVALTGDGGDELFAGYQRYQAMLAAEMLRRIPEFLREPLFFAANRLPDSTNHRSTMRKIRRFFEAAKMPFEPRYMKWVGIFDQNQKSRAYSQKFADSLVHSGVGKFFAPYVVPGYASNIVDTLLGIDSNTYLPFDLLVKADITSMANSLEARSPFLDYKLMEFVAQLPAELKMHNFVKKYILKNAMSGLLPDKNIHREKMGFGVPVGEWFRGELKGFLAENIMADKFFGRGYFNRPEIERMFKLHTEGKADYTFKLWALLMLELWHQKFYD